MTERDGDHIFIGALDPVRWFGLALFVVEKEQEELHAAPSPEEHD